MTPGAIYWRDEEKEERDYKDLKKRDKVTAANGKVWSQIR
jgi:hypothetical protein